MHYFSSATSLEAARRTYRRLVWLHHPDRGGDLATMQEINRQYDAFVRQHTSHPQAQHAAAAPKRPAAPPPSAAQARGPDTTRARRHRDIYVRRTVLDAAMTRAKEKVHLGDYTGGRNEMQFVDGRDQRQFCAWLEEYIACDQLVNQAEACIDVGDYAGGRACADEVPLAYRAWFEDWVRQRIRSATRSAATRLSNARKRMQRHVARGDDVAAYAELQRVAPADQERLRQEIAAAIAAR